MRLRSRVLTCLVSSIKRSQAPLQVPEPTCPSGIHPQRSSWVGWEGGMRTTGTLNSLNNIYNKQQEIGAFFWHLLAGNELSFEPSRHVAHGVVPWESWAFTTPAMEFRDGWMESRAAKATESPPTGALTDRFVMFVSASRRCTCPNRPLQSPFYLQKARHRLILQNQPLNGDTFPILVGPTLLRIHHHGSWTDFHTDPFTPFRAVASVSWHCKMMPLVLRRSLPALGTQAKTWTYIEEAIGHRRLDGCKGQLDAWNSLGMQVSSAKHKWNWVRQNSLKLKHA